MLDRICSLLYIKRPAISTGYLIASGTSVPGAVAGYKTGCIFQKTDGGTGTSLYVNEGSVTSASFQAISGITAAQEALLGATPGTLAVSKAVIADANGFVGLYQLGSAAAAANALLLGVGTTAAPALTSTANKDFVEIRAKSSATSGDGRLAYLRFDIGGAGGGGECLRAFTDLTAAAANANGSHISLQVGATGYVTGLGTGIRSQLYIKNEAVHANGTYYGLQAEVYSEGATSSIAGATKHAVLGIAATGNSTGMATVLNAISVDGTSAADATKMISSVSLAELPSGTVGIAVLVNGTRYYIPAVAVAEWN